MHVTDESDARVGELFRAHAGRVYAYARRHASANQAEDLVSEAFVVALRRSDRVPAEDQQALAWLLAVVRRLAANQRRRAANADQYWRAAVREAWHVDSGIPPDEAVAERESCVSALAAVSGADREALLLVAWEWLDVQQAAGVLGVSCNAFRVRLHRARRRVEAAYTSEARSPHVSVGEEER